MRTLLPCTFIAVLWAFVLVMAERQKRWLVRPPLTRAEQQLRDKTCTELRAELDAIYEIDHSHIPPDPHGMP